MKKKSCDWYRVFHGFGQAKFPDGGLVFRLEPIFNTAPAASKNTVPFKCGQNQQKIIISIC